MANNNNNKQQKQKQKQKQKKDTQEKQEEYTLAIILPQHLWAPINAMRSVRDNKMVHLKLLQTPLPQQQLFKVAELTERFPPFCLSFDSLVSSPSLSDSTSEQIRLLPSLASVDHMCKLNAELESALGIPSSSRAYVPFLHVTNVPKGQSVSFIEKLEKEFKPITFTTQDIHFIAREGKKDFSIRKSFPLSPSLSFSSSPSPIQLDNENNNNNNNNNIITITKDISSSNSAKISFPKTRPVPEVQESGIDSGTCFHFSHSSSSPSFSPSWVAMEKSAIQNVSAHHLKIATLNVLFDFHDSDKIHTHLRIPATLSLLKELDADVIALEEMTSPFLQRLLLEEWVQKGYYLSSLDVGYYGQLILSRFPFLSFHVVLGKKLKKELQHTAKKAVIAEFKINGKTINISAIHLTSDKSKNSSEKRKIQLNQIDSFMNSRGTENFISGDFNFGDAGENVLPNNYDDVWPLLHHNEPGYTYDVTKNTLAQITTCKNKDSRFDRILCKSHFWTPVSISLFGCDVLQKIANVEGFQLYPSDHFGVLALFETAPKIQIPNIEFSEKILSSDPLFSFLRNKNGLADKAYSESRKEILLFLSTAMEDVFGGEDWKMDLIGSSRLGLDASGSDLDLVVLGNLDRSLFFSLSVQVLSAQSCISEVRSLADAVVPVIKFTICGVHVDIQYCYIPNGNKIPRSAIELDDLTLFRLDKASLVAINGVKDSELILKSVPDFENFRLLVLFIKMWAKERRIYSSSVGYLGGYPIAILAARLHNLNRSLSPSELVSKFFVEYGEWDMKTTPFSLPNLPLSFPPLDPKKHAIPIFTPSKPVRIVIRNATQTTRARVKKELERGMDIVKNINNNGEVIWNELIAPENVTKNGANLVLNISSDLESNFAQWAGYVESRMVDIVIQIERLMRSRVSPPLLLPADRIYLSPPSPSLPSTRGYLFIGIDVHSEKCPEIAQILANNLDFTSLSRGASEGLHISIDVNSDISSIVTEGEAEKERKKQEDEKRTKKNGTNLGEFYSLRSQGALVFSLAPVSQNEIEDKIPQLITPAEDTQIAPASNNYGVASKVKRNKSIKYGGEISEKKLRMRTSVEVFNRITWDTSLPNDEFIIGYDDRFEGIMEVPFDEFDLESIPLHRIRIFKRNGITVWDRNERVDAVFKINARNLLKKSFKMNHSGDVSVQK